MWRLEIPALEFPLNFAALFAICAFVLGLCALAANRYVVPTAREELPRPRLLQGTREVGREMIADRILLFSVIAYLLVDAGSTILNNMALYTPIATGEPADAFAGYQNTLRFLFKVIAGLLLGWAITRFHAKMGLLATAGLCLVSVLWILLLPGKWFLVSFGLMGAGELYGVYFPNYIMNRSRPDRVRQNMAILQVLSLATGLAPPVFGTISDQTSLTESFVVAGCVLAIAFAIAFVLPMRPEQRSNLVAAPRMETVA
jgi:hypothetical protein